MNDQIERQDPIVVTGRGQAFVGDLSEPREILRFTQDGRLLYRFEGEMRDVVDVFDILAERAVAKAARPKRWWNR